ncbi:tyrosine-type recombinase/integrase [Tropicimonas aquimaris]|uniref:Tyrosine-type recombinase/integrase n=1 Tax=Tropicimonas aquimaris TaxID=914152 RepID=A0ABW3IQE7_9RHOB
MIEMPKVKLSKTFVEKTAPEDQEVIYWDETLPGFGLRVKPSGSKGYLVQYRNRRTGASRRKTIGQHGPLMTLHQAKEIARGFLSDAIRGQDPVLELRAASERRTIKDLARRYLETHAIPKKRPRSVKMDRSTLDRFILPAFGSRCVADIGHEDVQRLHNRMLDTPYQANRMLALLSKMFELAIRWEWRPNNPARGISRFPEEKRYRWLTDAELSRLLLALDRHSNQVAANAIRFQLLTGARIGEVLTATWKDLDLERMVWVKPSHHTKQKRTEHLPLSGAATALLRRMASERDHGNPHVFPGRKPGEPIKDLKRFWKAVTTEAGLDDYRIHDNRHTHASHLVSSGQSLAIVGRLLGHTNPTTTQRYAHLADDPLRQAAEVMGAKMAREKTQDPT